MENLQGKLLTSKSGAKDNLQNHLSDSRNLYTLFAVINHQGKMDSGHYTMFSKHRGEVFVH